MQLKLFLTLVTVFFLSLSSVQAATISKPPYLLTLNSGLVGHWTFDGAHITNGRINDISGQGNHGNVSGIATSTFYAVGKIGQGVRFDGVNDYVRTSYQLSNSQPFTISVWAYFNNVDTGVQALFSQDSTGTDDIGLAYLPGDGLQWEAEVDAHTTDQTVTFRDGSVPTGWHHIVIVEKYEADVNTNDYYFDGVKIDQDAACACATNAPGSTALTIGNRTDADIGFDGIIDDFRVYNRTLSQSEVTQLYNLGASKLGVTRTSDSLKSGLVGHWTFDGKDMPNGRVNDLSGQGNHGNLANIATSTFYTVGKIGQGGQFDGVDDYVSFGSIGLMDAEPFSVSVWFYADNPVSGTNQTLVSSSDSAGLADTTTDAQYVLLNTSGQITAFSHRSTSGSGAVGPVASANTWYHVVGVYENSSLRSVYVNGVFIGSNAGGEAVNTPDNFRIGSRKHSGGEAEFFDGKIDDVRVYNRTLSASEVTQLYNLGVSKLGVTRTSDSLKSGLVGHWTFDGKDMIGGVAQDISGQGNHGNTVSTATSTFYATGKIGQALKFDGVNDYIRVSATPVTAYPFTFSAWIKLPPGVPSGAIVSTQDGGSTVPYYRILHFDGVAALGVRPDSGAEVYATGTTDLRDNTWHHIVGVATSATSRDIYVDGVFVDNDSANRAFNPVTNVSIGVTARSAPVTYLNASVDDVRIYNRVLTATEVLQLYNAGK